MEQPRAGVHYPRSTGEFQAWFRTDADCLDYLEWLRWPGGFTCPSCGHAGGWRLGDGRYECAACHGRTSVTAGTIFDRTRTPLTVWFTACWLFATAEGRHLGAEPAAVAGDRLLPDRVGDAAPAAVGAGAAGPGPAVRDRARWTRPTSAGRSRGCAAAGPGARRCSPASRSRSASRRGSAGAGWRVLADGSADSLHPFVTGDVEPGAPVITDAWQGYRGLDGLGYVHERRSQRGRPRPRRGPRRAAARRAPGRLAGQAVAAGHPPGLGRRGAPARLPGRVRVPVQPAPLAQPRHGVLPGAGARRRARPGPLPGPARRQEAAPVPRPRRGWGHPPSLDRPAANRPWRTGELQLQLPILLRLSEYPRTSLWQAEKEHRYWARRLTPLPAIADPWASPLASSATPGDQLQDLRHWLAACAGTRLEAWSGWPH